jgi:hypothetical protein
VRINFLVGLAVATLAACATDGPNDTTVLAARVRFPPP